MANFLAEDALGAFKETVKLLVTSLTKPQGSATQLGLKADVIKSLGGFRHTHFTVHVVLHSYYNHYALGHAP